MARGIRKSQLEKLQEELNNIAVSIQRYEESITTLQNKEVELRQQIELEEFRELITWLSEREMTIEDLKNVIQSDIDLKDMNNTELGEEKQSA